MSAKGDTIGETGRFPHDNLFVNEKRNLLHQGTMIPEERGGASKGVACHSEAVPTKTLDPISEGKNGTKKDPPRNKPANIRRIEKATRKQYGYHWEYQYRSPVQVAWKGPSISSDRFEPPSENIMNMKQSRRPRKNIAETSRYCLELTWLRTQ